jgi:5-methylthioadenosine/S-adenosylhomocysteine deaminase
MSEITEADLIVNGGAIVTMNAERTIVSDGGIAVRDRRIIAVGKRETIARDYRGQARNRRSE